MPYQSKRPEIVTEVLTRIGGGARLAELLGIRQSSIASWTRIPAQHVRRISAETKMPPAVLRPDLFGQ